MDIDISSCITMKPRTNDKRYQLIYELSCPCTRFTRNSVAAASVRIKFLIYSYGTIYGSHCEMINESFVLCLVAVGNHLVCVFYLEFLRTNEREGFQK